MATRGLHIRALHCSHRRCASEARASAESPAVPARGPWPVGIRSSHLGAARWDLRLQRMFLFCFVGSSRRSLGSFTEQGRLSVSGHSEGGLPVLRGPLRPACVIRAWPARTSSSVSLPAAAFMSPASLLLRVLKSEEPGEEPSFPGGWFSFPGQMLLAWPPEGAGVASCPLSSPCTGSPGFCVQLAGLSWPRSLPGPSHLLGLAWCLHRPDSSSLSRG